MSYYNLRLSMMLILSLTAVSTAANQPTFGTVTPGLRSTDPRAEITASDNQSLTIGFELNDLRIEGMVKDGRNFDSYSIPGEGITYDYGKPILPAVSRFVVVPPYSGLELAVDADPPRRVLADNPPVICSDEDITASVFMDVPDKAVYPPIIAEMSEPTIIRGVRLVKITTYPVQYDPSTQEYLLRDHIRADVRFTDDEPVNPVTHPGLHYASPHFLKYMENFAINGDQVRRDQSLDVDPPYVGHYAIATRDNCLQYIRPFIEWRRKSGYKVDILNFSVGDAANSNRVKNAIQDLYDSYVDDGEAPFEYLLLVGDRNVYSHQPGVGWVLDAPAGNSVWPGGARHADYLYGTLDGNDSHPDVAIGRWWVGSRATCELAVGRTLMYEATPWMEDTDWFNRAGAYSQHWGNSASSAWHITIHTNVRWGYEVLDHLGYEDITFYENYDWDRTGAVIGPELRDWFNEGLSVMIGRAEVYYWQSTFQGVQRNHVFPINICVSGHGEWACETMTRNGSGNDLKGPVNMTCGWGWPATTPSSAVWLEMVNACLLKDLPMGWAYTIGITAFEGYMQNYQMRNQPIYTHMKTDINHFGDPGIQPWIGVPRLVEAEFTETANSDTRLIDVHVVDADDHDVDVPDAQVTLYAPGDMPDGGGDNYAEYDDMYMQTRRSDEDGNVHFVIEDTELEQGTNIYITVTGRDIRPYFGEIEIEQPRIAIELSDYDLNEVEGNDDGDINPGETISLRLTAANVGNREDAADVTATVTSLSPWIEVEGDPISFGDINHGEEAEGETAVNLVVSPVCPDGASRPVTRPELLITFSSGETNWTSAIKLTAVAPNFEVQRIIGGNIIQVGPNDIDIEIKNVGGMDSPALTADLVTLGMGASVAIGESHYDAIRSGRSARLDGNDFRVAGNRIVVPGSLHEMMLILSSEAGFVDTAWFQVQVREPIDNGPIGPDPYGYICFDDSDDDWDISPDYNWVEICPRADWEFRGTEMDFTGHSDHDIGEALVVELGFTTIFYGHEYDRITVGSNGFIAMGDHSGDGEHPVTNFQNWPMDRAMGGGVGMIAPLWDNLRLSDGGIYYYRDEENARFIVEWYRLRHASGGDRDLIFQVILYDGDVWITESGDQNILIQYQSVGNVRGQINNEQQGNAPYQIAYASVGISGPNGSGLSYSFGNEYPTGAAPLQNRRALLFSTSPQYKSGTLFGRVIDAANDEPIEGASVYTEHGFIATTDENGEWRINDALAEVPFNITASLLGYNDSTLCDLEVEEDGELEINFALLHPEFDPSTRTISRILDPERQTEVDFTLTNPGNGPLYWS
ncbi:MAG TPA: hypothetical protein ENL08_02510, partial [Bacteroidetes bacterium]|nr:hypothetical protein [Bacteroidota bacterium]